MNQIRGRSSPAVQSVRIRRAYAAPDAVMFLRVKAMGVVVSLFLYAAPGVPTFAQEAPSEPQPAREWAAGEPDAETLAAVSRVVADALEKIAPSIVRIETIGGAQPVRSRPEGPGGRRGTDFRQGDGPSTGVIWTSDGYILTSSFHFVRDPTVITVILRDERRFVARLVARDLPGRLALLRVDATDLAPIPRIRREELRVGQWVISAGYGHGTAYPAPSLGIISATGRMNGMAIQTDAKISPANYGGPLFDLGGRMVGVCVPMGMSTDEVAGVEWYDSGIGFATHVNRIERHFARMAKGENIERGFLGVSLEPEDLKPQPATPPAEPRGLRIGGSPRGPAIAAGLRAGDLVLALDDVPTPRLVDLRRVLWAAAAGDSMRVRYLRDGVICETTLTLASADSLRAAEQPAPTTQPDDAGSPGPG